MSEHIERADICDDCEELLSNFEENFLRIRERKCLFCTIYLQRDKPCDKCGAIAKWFYPDSRPGKVGLCDACAPEEQKSTFK